MDFKFCPKCKTEKYISDFSPDKTTKSGFSSWFDTPPPLGVVSINT